MSAGHASKSEVRTSEYAARLDREAQAEPEAEQQAETWNGFEMEL